MQQQLEQLNQYLLDFQLKTNEEDNNQWAFSYADKVSYSKYDGLFDITWFTSDYGTASYPLDELGRYDQTVPLNTRQHCDCEPLNVSECECEYEGQGFSWLIDLLITYPEKIRSLTFTGTDSGANGLRGWCFNRLLESDVLFPNLIHFSVQLHEVGNHNINFIGYDEIDHAQVTQLLAKMPNIFSLQLPTTPDKDFFKRSYPNLRVIKIQSGFDSNHFIKNIAKSELLSQITLDFTDVLCDDELSYRSPDDEKMRANIEAKELRISQSNNPKEAEKEEERRLYKEAGLSDEEISLMVDNPNREETLRLLKITCDSDQEVKESMEHMDSVDTWDENGEAILYEDDYSYDDYQPSESFQKRTLLDDYITLFESKYIPDGFHFKLRESYLTKDELYTLQNANKKVQFLHIPTHSDYYVSHRMQDAKQW